jgi:hypothetical protein
MHFLWPQLAFLKHWPHYFGKAQAHLDCIPHVAVLTLVQGLGTQLGCGMGTVFTNAECAAALPTLLGEQSWRQAQHSKVDMARL